MNNESNNNGAAHGEQPAAPPPAYPPQSQNPAESPQMTLEQIQYMQEQERQREIRILYAQLYCAALTGVLSADPRANTVNASQTAQAHANTGLRVLQGGQAQTVASNIPTGQGQNPQALARGPQNPYQNPTNPYGGPPARGGIQPPGPGQTQGPTGQIATGLGNFKYDVTYGPPPPPQQFNPQAGGFPPPGFGPPGGYPQR